MERSQNSQLLPRKHSGSFLTDLKSSQPPKSLGSLLIAYNTTLSSLLDRHAPIITKLTRRQSPSNPCTPCFQIYRLPCRNIPTLQSTGPLLSFCVVKRNVTTPTSSPHLSATPNSSGSTRVKSRCIGLPCSLCVR